MKLVINSNAKKALVFKAMGLKTLRILSGHNLTDFDEIDELSPYMVGNKAAQAMFKDHCSGVDPKHVNKKQAEASKKRNDELNKAQKIISVANENLLKKEDENAVLEKQVKDQDKKLESQGKKLDKMAKMIEKLEAKLDKKDK